MTVAIYGLPRSGTNALGWLIRHNLAVEIRPHDRERPTTKHGNLVHPTLPVVAIVRNPLSWLVAHYRAMPPREKRQWGTFEAFLAGNPMRGPGAVYLWNFAAGYWLWHPHPRKVVVTYEAMLATPDSVVEQVANLLGVSVGKVRVPDRYAAPHPTGETRDEIIQRELVAKWYLSKYTPKQLAFVRKWLDPHVMEALYP